MLSSANSEHRNDGMFRVHLYELTNGDDTEDEEFHGLDEETLPWSL